MIPTYKEVIVVVGLIGLMAALLFPAVQAAREIANKPKEQVTRMDVKRVLQEEQETYKIKGALLFAEDTTEKRMRLHFKGDMIIFLHNSNKVPLFVGGGQKGVRQEITVREEDHEILACRYLPDQP